MAQIDAGAIEAIISGQASSDTGYSPVIQVINATEIKNNQTGAGSGRCAPTRPLSPPRRPAARRARAQVPHRHLRRRQGALRLGLVTENRKKPASVRLR
jgi:hypothetical protein